MGARYYWNRRATTEEMKSISIPFLKEHGYMDTNRWGTITWSRGDEQAGNISMYSFENIPKSGKSVKTVTVSYTRTDYNTGERKHYNYDIELLTTECFFGDRRYWFKCPNCGRRVGVLYLGETFACRKCYNLTYDSCNVDRRGSVYIFRRALELDEKIGELEKTIKRTHYNGKITKKFAKFLELERQRDWSVFACLQQREMQ